MCHSGGAHLVLRKYAEIWDLDTDHFDAYAASRGTGFARARPLEEILVENSDFSRVQLKRRLYEAGLKQPVCELCGQDSEWRGRELGMILDHVNGVSDDNRIENLRIVCPNCAATLDTHCGRKRRQLRRSGVCAVRAAFRTEAISPALLLARVRCSLEPRSITTCGAYGRPATLFPAPTGDSRRRLLCDGPGLRRVGQRDPQMDSSV